MNTEQTTLRETNHSHPDFIKSSDLGTVIGSRHVSRRKPGTWQYPGVPPFPTFQAIKPVTIPSPPRIDPTWSDDTKVSFLARTWTTTIEHCTGGTCWLLRSRCQGRGKKKKLVSGVDKHLKDLLAAISLCEAYALQPAAWIEFSFHEWAGVLKTVEKKNITATKKSRGRKRRKLAAPTIPWVFSKTRIEKRRGWYGHELERKFYHGSIKLTAKHKNILYQHALMRSALMLLDDPSQEQIEKTIDNFFPEHYGLLVRQCETEITKEQNRLDKLANEGEWLWL